MANIHDLIQVPSKLLEYENRYGEDDSLCNFWIIQRIPLEFRNIDGADVKILGYTSSKGQYERMQAMKFFRQLDLRSFVIPVNTFVEEMKSILEYFNNNPDWFGEFVSTGDPTSMIGYSTHMQTFVWYLYPESLRKLAFPLKSLGKPPERYVFEGIFEKDIAEKKVGVPNATCLEKGSNFWILESEKVRAQKPEDVDTGRGYTQCEDIARWFLEDGDCTIQSYQFDKYARDVQLLNQFIGECANNKEIGCGWGHPQRTSAFFYIYYKQNQPRNETLEKGVHWPELGERPDEDEWVYSVKT